MSDYSDGYSDYKQSKRRKQYGSSNRKTSKKARRQETWESGSEESGSDSEPTPRVSRGNGRKNEPSRNMDDVRIRVMGFTPKYDYTTLKVNRKQKMTEIHYDDLMNVESTSEITGIKYKRARRNTRKDRNRENSTR